MGIKDSAKRLADKINRGNLKEPEEMEKETDVVNTTQKTKETKREETTRLEEDVAAYEKYQGVVTLDGSANTELACLMFAVFSELRKLSFSLKERKS